MSLCKDCISGIHKVSIFQDRKTDNIDFYQALNTTEPQPVLIHQRSYSLLASSWRYRLYYLTGKIEHIGGIETYVATPEGDYAKDKVILIITDAFGLELVNNKVMNMV